MQTKLQQIKVRLFADGADKEGILKLNANPLIQGMTTNPTLMRKAGVKDYEAFARDVLQSVTTKPISFEVFSDDLPEMHRQAKKIATWGRNVYIKIPITNTRGESTLPVIRELGKENAQLNITAILTLDQKPLTRRCRRWFRFSPDGSPIPASIPSR
jgi:transaldolase